MNQVAKAHDATSCYDAVIFDLDGTLIDSAHDIAAALSAAFLERGWPALAPGYVENFIGNGPRRLVADILSDHSIAVPEDRIDEALAAYLAHYARNPADHTRFYPHVREDLRALHATGLRLGICTNKPQGLTERILDITGIGTLFETVVGADAVPACKPDPGHLRHVAARMRLGAADYAYVGDTKVDQLTAQAAGIPFFVVPWGKGEEVAVPAGQRLTRLAVLAALAAGRAR
ncbi:MAG TPA: HAD-IA family hydrolase [Acidisoma sp.]|uniref:HAD-IA family hydrolase n=1 Tax=Acidisoma sp. TaxID=1872115 RepID=UPI002C4462DA|nr:HAD-IA family hydrolase [Acidisoma sp.]HTI01800.1 HAD-IA family hydrolase [Acidisoma sp.]